jgi:tetratricopeptide (TPR) repeat protein
MRLLVFPTMLSPDYGAKVVGWTVQLNDPYLWIGVAAALGWAIATIVAVKRRYGFAAFCLLALGFSYGMTGNVIAIVGANMAERWMYLPSAFFLMFVAVLIARLPCVLRWSLVGVLLVLASARTVTYASWWNDPLTFYTRTLAEQPMSGQLHMLAATEYADRGMYREADEVMRDATERFPDSWHVWMRWGAILTEQGRFEEAETYLLRAFHINPNPMVILYGMRLEAKKEAAHAATTRATTQASTAPVPPKAHGSAVGP